MFISFIHLLQCQSGVQTSHKRLDAEWKLMFYSTSYIEQHSISQQEGSDLTFYSIDFLGEGGGEAGWRVGDGAQKNIATGPCP